MIGLFSVQCRGYSGADDVKRECERESIEGGKSAAARLSLKTPRMNRRVVVVDGDGVKKW